MLAWAEECDLSVKATFLPGVENRCADRESRALPVVGNWKFRGGFFK